MRLDVNKKSRLWWTLSAAVVVAGLISMVISWQQLGAAPASESGFCRGDAVAVGIGLFDSGKLRSPH